MFNLNFYKFSSGKVVLENFDEDVNNILLDKYINKIAVVINNLFL